MVEAPVVQTSSTITTRAGFWRKPSIRCPVPCVFSALRTRKPCTGFPIVVATAVISAQQQQGKPVHGFLVRKAEKTHGTGQRIEGFRQKPARVVIVDDVCTTGASTMQAIEVAREFGFDIVGVLCLVERQEAGGRANVEKAAAPVPFVALFTANDVRAEHVKTNAPPIFAVSAKCDLCDRPAVTNSPGNRCDLHRP